MIQLRLTHKVQKAVGLKPSDLAEVQENTSRLGSWTVNLFNQDRRKVLIFVNDRTLYSFILFGARKEHYKALKETFCLGLQQLLSIDGFSEKEQIYLMHGLDNISFSKTSSKKVLGNMNDLVWHYKFLISGGGGIESANVGEIIHQINRMPQRNIGWSYSIDAVSKIAAMHMELGGLPSKCDRI